MIPKKVRWNKKFSIAYFNCFKLTPIFDLKNKHFKLVVRANFWGGLFVCVGAVPNLEWINKFYAFPAIFANALYGFVIFVRCC